MLRIAMLCLLLIVACGGSDNATEIDEGRYDELVGEVAERYNNDFGDPADESHVRVVVENIVEDTDQSPVELLEIMADLPDSVESVREAAILASLELGPG